jgi:rod shape determining protein RodA
LEDREKNSLFDYPLLFIIFLFMIISCVSIYSAQQYEQYDENFVAKQIVWYIGGMIVTTVVYLFDFEQIKRFSPYLYGIGLIILGALIVSPESIAPVIKGAKSWFVIPGFGSLQPSEFMKIFLILFLSKVITSHNEVYFDERSLSSDFLLLGKVLAVAVVPIGLILLQPDAGTAMVVTAITIGILFVSGINWIIILVGLLFAGLILTGIVFIFVKNPDWLLVFMDQYQLNRIYAWLDPFKYEEDIGFQLANSILAIGSGLIYGNGLDSTLSVRIPEAHSDFIFTVIAENFGFLGASIVICLYFLLIYRIIVIALKNKGEYEALIATGVISMLTFHIFENIGMVIGLVPITGIPLPLLSYGGSSILATLFALGIISNITSKTQHYMFESDDE